MQRFQCYIWKAGMCKYSKEAMVDTCHCEIVERYLRISKDPREPTDPIKMRRFATGPNHSIRETEP